MANWNLFHPELSGVKFSPHLSRGGPLWGPILQWTPRFAWGKKPPPKVAHRAGEPSSLTPKVSLSGYRPGGLTHGVNGNPPVFFFCREKKLRTVIFSFAKQV